MNLTRLRTFLNQTKKVLPKTLWNYTTPPRDIIQRPSKVETNNRAQGGRTLIECLKSFKIEATLEGSIIGPSVTTYKLSTAPGTSFSKIKKLTSEIMASLQALSVRIVAPIPGTKFIGIEIPNVDREPVTFYDMVMNFPQGTPTTVAIGKSNTGDFIYGDLAKMPHLIVAGTTGSGKSVALQGMISSLLMNNTPETLQLALIDPKRSEFVAYEGLPHLYAPVVYTDTNASRSLVESLVEEMERRNVILAKAKVKDIKAYNKKAKKPMPYIVLIIEEYADLVMADAAARKRKEAVGITFEESICRIAQKARSAGIHAILATQRPSSDVVSPLVKTNFPSAIACKVRGSRDSGIILDETGAEALLGNGDMLYKPTGSFGPERLQGVFVPDNVIESIVDHYKGV